MQMLQCSGIACRAAARQGYRVPGVHGQNRKYRWAIGSTSAGSQVSNSPSARTS